MRRFTTFSRCDVDAELHRRRAEQHREVRRAEALLAFLAFLGAHLGGVLARFDALGVARLVAVEVDEELVRAAAVGGRAWHADLVVRGHRAVAGEPAQLGRRDLVSGDAVVPCSDLLDEAVAAKRFEDPDDDRAGVRRP